MMQKNTLEPEPQIHLLQAVCRHMRGWQHEDLSAPFWRLYWNPTPGAFVLHEDGQTALTPDRVVLIPPHTAYATRLEQPCRHFFVHFMLGRDFSVRAGIYEFAADASFCRATLDCCRKSSSGPARTLMLYRYVTTMLARIPAEDWREPVRDPRLRRALRSMEQNPGSPPSNRELARVASLSTNGFVRLFRQTLGQPPQTYQMNRRIERACAALANTEKSVETIAAETGFCDRAHLTRMFKKYVHNTPGAYRQEHRHM